jgi:opacity protein-like surface antigen
MKKILLSLTAVAALAAAAAPAAAQSWRGQDGYAQRGYDNHQRGYGGSQLTTRYVDGLQWKIQNAANQGRISRGEARSLTAELRSVQPLTWKVQTGRASGWERQRLERTVSRIDQAVSSYARYDRGHRDYGYGYGDQRRR